jgi:glycosyltransferase involved in cell wall biosynthesis
MRIALVITELDPGGAEKCLTQLGCYLADLGHSVKVFAIGPPPIAGQDHFLHELETHHVPVAFSLAAGRVRSTRSFPKVVRWLRAELSQFAPEVVQAMLFHGNLLAALAVDRKRVRLFGGVRVRQPERWRWWLELWASRRMLKLVCVSEDVARHCEKFEHIAPDKLITIPNGVDLQAVDRIVEASSDFKWAQFGLPADARVLLFVGRLHTQKGIEELVTRADDLLRGLPQHHLVVIGSGPLESRLRELAIARVHFLGWQSEVLAWMHRSEVLLLPASYEGMPNVLLEAMAVGLPFIAFDVDGVRQLLGDSTFASNQVAVPGDYTKFVALARHMTQDDDLRSHCASSNRKRIEQHFQLHDQLAAYLDLYRASTPRSL